MRCATLTRGILPRTPFAIRTDRGYAAARSSLPQSNHRGWHSDVTYVSTGHRVGKAMALGLLILAVLSSVAHAHVTPALSSPNSQQLDPPRSSKSTPPQGASTGAAEHTGTQFVRTKAEGAAAGAGAGAGKTAQLLQQAATLAFHAPPSSSSFFSLRRLRALA
eukprot:3143434-Rhodomonas_salina.1